MKRGKTILRWLFALLAALGLIDFIVQISTDGRVQVIFGILDWCFK